MELKIVKHCEKQKDLVTGVNNVKKPLKEDECIVLEYGQAYPRGMNLGLSKQPMTVVAFKNKQMVDRKQVRKGGICELKACDTVVEAHESLFKELDDADVEIEKLTKSTLEIELYEPGSEEEAKEEEEPEAKEEPEEEAEKPAPKKKPKKKGGKKKRK